MDFSQIRGVEIPLNCPILCLADTIDICKDYAQHFMIEKNGVFEIAPMSANSIGTVFIGILADLPGWKEYAVDIHAKFAQDLQRFVLNNEKQLEDVNRARSMHPNGKNTTVPIAFKYVTALLILSVALKSTPYGNVLVNADNQLEVLCKIANIPLKTLSVSKETVDTMISIKVNLRAFIAQIAEPLFNDDLPGEEPNHKQIRKCVQKMISGWEMTGFMAIESFVFTTEILKAHIDRRILREVMEYKSQSEAMLKRLNGKPMGAYKLLFPSGPDMNPREICNLKWLAVNSNKRKHSSWSNFANIDNKTTIPVAELKQLFERKPVKRSCSDEEIIKKRRF